MSEVDTKDNRNAIGEISDVLTHLKLSGIHSDILDRLNSVVQLLEAQAQAHAQAQAQAQAQAELTKFSDIILQSLPFPIDIVDTEGTILLANKHMLDLFGQNILGQPCWKVYRDNRLQCEHCPLRGPISFGQTKSIESKGVFGGQTFDISHTWIEFQGKPAVLEVFQNITASKHSEQALRESEGRLKDLLMSSADWVWETDERGVYTFSSQKGLDLLGEVIGKTPFDFMPPDEAARVGPLFSQIVKNKAPIRDLENWNIAKDGSKVYLLTNGVPILDEQGVLKGYRGLDKNITERKHAEQALVASESRFRTMSNAAPVLIWTAGVDKLCTWFNQTWLDFTGRTMEQELGNGWAEGVHPEDFDRCLATYVTAFDKREAFSMKYRVRKADGQYGWLLDNGSPLFEGETFKGYVGSCTDITDMITARAELDRVASVSPDLICVADTNGYFKRVNPSFTRALGYTQEELTSQAVLNFVHPEDLAATIKEIEKLAQGQVTLHFENRYRAKSGDYLILNWVTQPDSQTGLLYSIARDVTDARKKERQIEKLLASVPVMIGYWDKHLRNVTANDRYLEYFGKTPGQLLGTHFRDLMGPAFENVRPHVNAALAGTTASFENELPIANGSIRRFQVIYHPDQIEGRVEGFYSVAVDVTEQREASLRFEQMANSIDEVFWMTDLEKKRIVYISPAYASIWGLSCQSLYDNPASFIEAIHPEDRARVIQAFARQIDGTYDETYRIIRPDGSVRWVHDRSYPPVLAGGNALRVIGVAQDITAQKNSERVQAETQAQLIHSTRMASIGTLATGVAHEINNPLAIMSLNCDLLSRQITKFAAHEEVAEYLKAQRTAIKRAATIVNQLRSFARTDTEAIQVWDIHKVIRDSLDFCEPVYAKDGVTIKERLNAKQTSVLANDGKLQQVIVNLLSNAKDACEGNQKGNQEGGIIRIETSDEGASVVIRVSDNGAGISKEHLPRIFDPFFTTKAPGKGTGLGLSISHTIIRSFGGTMAVTSEQGEGTAISITIPLSSSSGLSSPAVLGKEHQVNAPTKGERQFSGHALIVDDEADLRKGFEAMLKNLGLSVSVAPDGAAALEILKGMTFDYVFADKKMPGMNGFALIDEAHKFAHLAKTRFIMMSGDLEFSPQSPEEKVRIYGYLTKPFDMEALVALL